MKIIRQKQFASIRLGKKISSRNTEILKKAIRKNKTAGDVSDEVAKYVKKISKTGGKMAKTYNRQSMTDSYIDKLSSAAVNNTNKVRGAAKKPLHLGESYESLKKQHADGLRHVSNFAKNNNGRKTYYTT